MQYSWLKKPLCRIHSLQFLLCSRGPCAGLLLEETLMQDSSFCVAALDALVQDYCKKILALLLGSKGPYSCGIVKICSHILTYVHNYIYVYIYIYIYICLFVDISS